MHARTRLAALVIALLSGAPLGAQEPAPPAVTDEGLFFASVDDALDTFVRTQGQLEQVDRLLAQARAAGLLSDDRLAGEVDSQDDEDEEDAEPTAPPSEADLAARAALADGLTEHLARHAALSAQLRWTAQAVRAMAPTHRSDLLAALDGKEPARVDLVAEALSALLPDVDVEAAFVRAARRLKPVPARLRACLLRCGPEGVGLVLDLGLAEKDLTAVASALGAADGSGIARVVAATASRDPELAAVALRGLGRARPDPADDLGSTTERLAALSELLRGPALSVEARCALVSFMGRHVPPATSDGGRPDRQERMAQVSSALRQAYDEQLEEQVRSTIAAALGAVEHPEATSLLLELLSADESTPALRHAALAGLVRARTLDAVPALIDLLEHRGLPPSACRKALRTITGRDYGESHEAWRGWWANR